MDEVDGTLAGLSAELVAFRRDLHAHPELSWEEKRTSEKLVDRLAAAGLEPALGDGGTGVVCDLPGPGPAAGLGHEGPLVVLRADIDALAMVDRKEVPYRSTNPGVCHSCGHDVHTAAVLGAGLALQPVLGPDGGRVRLLFQPAEETIPGGARGLQRAGVTSGAAAILALHCAPALEVGTIGLSAGLITSAADLIDVTLGGPGGHTARPHRTADLVHIAARVVVDLPLGLSRLVDSRDGLNVTFGTIEAGEAPNVIPSAARIQGSLRARGHEAWERAPGLVDHLLRAIVEPLGATYELDYQRGSPPVDNDAGLVDVVRAVATEALGADAVGPTEQSAGGEDFSWYLRDAPGCFVRLGTRPPGAPVRDIHTPHFDVDESAITIGARLLARSALAVLRQ